MSRLTSTVFNKPSPYDVPRPVHPLSPPDTEQDFPVPASSQMLPAIQDTLDLNQLPAPADTPGARLRRVAYINSGLRPTTDSRDRDRSVQKSLRWLVVVVPPPSLAEHELRNLGHTLSSGPHHRLSHGIMMPLFPTMYGQLTAIAREFSFPSTAGLCLYLHMNEAGITSTPRISDETWQFLWSHLFDPRSPGPAPQGLPIGGRLEFDIDVRKARWFEPWLAASRREANDFPMSVAPSLHGRHGSRGSLNLGDGSPHDEEDNGSIAPATIRRHIPRKLSLLDRFDTVSVRSFASKRPVGPHEMDMSEAAPHALAPILQENEPKTTKRELESRVKSWRASAKAPKTPLLTHGQPSLDPANMPNSVSLGDPALARVEADDEEQSEFNLEDFTWSISSAGPPSDPPSPAFSWGNIMSPHLDRRNEGSVCMTPSLASSFGPELYYDDEHQVLYEAYYDSPVHTPDLARRMLSDCPPTPTTVTSWGPPSEWPGSPAYAGSEVPSVDVAYRQMASRPVTPSTATSWGPASWPASPVNGYAFSDAPSVDFAYRNMLSRPATPTTATSWGPASWPGSPAYSEFSEDESVDLGARVDDGRFAGPVQRSRMAFPYYDVWQKPAWHGVWPYNAHQEPVSGEPWRQVWPYRAAMPALDNAPHGDAAYPHIRIYAPVYPHFDMYPAAAAEPHVDASKVIDVKLNARYPAFDLYPAVYPNLDVYPSVPKIERVVAASNSTGVPIKLAKQYPVFDLYPAGYPQSIYEIYVPTTAGDATYYKSLSVTLPAVYPAFDLYAPAYPVMTIYPSPAGELIKSGSPVQRQVKAARGAKLMQQYPDFNLYPAGEKLDDTYYFKSLTVSLNGAALVYPVLTVYPSVRSPATDRKAPPPRVMATAMTRDVRRPLKSPMPQRRRLSISRAPAMPPMPRVLRQAPMSPRVVEAPHSFAAVQQRYITERALTSPTAYPNMCVYPAAYPNFDLYPAPAGALAEGQDWTGFAVSYPVFNLYPAAYPNMDVYPAVAALVGELQDWTGFAVSYPVFNLYPAAYPHMDVYPAVAALMGELQDWSGFSVRYPAFNIYPAAYPHMDIYPAVAALMGELQDWAGFDVRYPAFNIYPAAYPHMDIYPVVLAGGAMAAETVESFVAAAYPTFSLYPALYPFLEVYHGYICDGSLAAREVTLSASYPMFSIYPSHYPSFEIYPGEVSTGEVTICRSLPTKLAAAYPAFDFYTVEYPAFAIYPAVSCVEVTPPRRGGDRHTYKELYAEVIAEQPTRSFRARRTHRQLHGEVVAWNPALFRRRPSRTHADLHNAVMKEMPVHSRQPSVASISHSRQSSSERPVSRSRSGTVSTRPPSAFDSRPASTVGSRPPSVVGSRPPSTFSSRPSSTASSRPPSLGPVSPASTLSSPLGRRLATIPGSPLPDALPPPNRPLPARPDDAPQRASMASRPAPSVDTQVPVLRHQRSLLSAVEKSAPPPPVLDRSKSLSDVRAGPPHRKRESVVLQRAQAYEQAVTQNDPSSAPMRITKETLLQFPMPPKPPVPAQGLPAGPRVSKLDRTKFPFA